MSDDDPAPDPNGGGDPRPDDGEATDSEGPGSTPAGSDRDDPGSTRTDAGDPGPEAAAPDRRERGDSEPPAATDRSAGGRDLPAGSSTGPRDGSSDGADRPSLVGDSEDLRTRVLRWTLGILAVVAVAALFQFYVHATGAIDVWVADRYRDVVLAAFNLVVLLCASVGVSLVVRELTDDEDSSE